MNTYVVSFYSRCGHCGYEHLTHSYIVMASSVDEAIKSAPRAIRRGQYVSVTIRYTGDQT